jgi:hypothetical protein
LVFDRFCFKKDKIFHFKKTSKGMANTGDTDRVLFFLSTSSSKLKEEEVGETFNYNKSVDS